MEVGKLLSLTLKAHMLAESAPIGPNTYFFIENVFIGKPVLDSEIKKYLEKIIKKIHSLLSNVDSKEVENVAMYAVYQELLFKNQIMEEYMKEFGSFGHFKAYFRHRLSDPFC